ncbi:MAG: hypothetical protein K1X87_10560 [Dehalococcoidia bacterium]|nr:hypothetical protein [Dehalococcoidia bacterium]
MLQEEGAGDVRFGAGGFVPQLSDGDRAFIGPFEPVAPTGDGNEPSALLIPVP